MLHTIEIAVDTADGLADCRLEQLEEGSVAAYSVTILYPHTVQGRLMPKVYDHMLRLNRQTGKYCFADADMVHPTIERMAGKLSEAILNG